MAILKPARQKVERPRVKEFKPDPLIEMAVRLYRLVCT